MPDLLAGSIIRGMDTPPTEWDIQDVAVGAITSGTYAASTGGSAVCATTFVAGTTGRILIKLSAECDNNASSVTLCSFRLGEGAVVGAGTEVIGATDNIAVSNLGTNQVRASIEHPQGGLTPGLTYNLQTMHRVTGGTGIVTRRVLIVTPAT